MGVVGHFVDVSIACSSVELTWCRLGWHAWHHGALGGVTLVCRNCSSASAALALIRSAIAPVAIPAPEALIMITLSFLLAGAARYKKQCRPICLGSTMPLLTTFALMPT